MVAYATVADMVSRFGEAEMIRLTTPDGADMVAVVAQPAQAALNEASAVIDTYLRRRYRVPLDVAPLEIRRAACILARYDLASAGSRTPSDLMTTERKDVTGWLREISTGNARLDLDEVTVSDESYAQAQTRPATFGACEGMIPGGPFS